MIDAGVGHGPSDFEGLQIRIIPKGASIDGVWSEPSTSDHTEQLCGGSAYVDLEQRIGQCGALTLARASVAVPFVGAAAGALVISQIARLATLLPATQLLQMELGAPNMTSLSALTPAPRVNLGSCSLALSPLER